MRRNIFTLLFISVSFCRCEKDASSASASINTSAGQGGSLARFAIVGDYLYTIDAQKLTVYDATNAGNPVVKQTVNVGFDIETIFPFGDKLFLGSTSAVYIFSITDPANPQKLSTAISPQVLRRCDPVVAKDTVAYATLRTNGHVEVFKVLLPYITLKISRILYRWQPIRSLNLTAWAIREMHYMFVISQVCWFSI